MGISMKNAEPRKYKFPVFKSVKNFIVHRKVGFECGAFVTFFMGKNDSLDSSTLYI
ncbi:unnamed protein product [marine sediment metagenome]|uniref:Uncharacterized protein n=1 Tax=marine sediment metagenome TaxID=412755 RepID=X1CJ61_9ZZZZ